MSEQYSYANASALASAFLRQTQGGTLPNKANSATKKEIEKNLTELIEIGFGSKGINFNAYGVKRMLLVYTKTFHPDVFKQIKQRYDQ